jgi:hypothetical protein
MVVVQAARHDPLIANDQSFGNAAIVPARFTCSAFAPMPPCFLEELWLPWEAHVE